jgi:alkylated DNA repair dioxygenase AlkB
MRFSVGMHKQLIIENLGIVWYAVPFIGNNKIFNELLEKTAWTFDEVKIFGRSIITRRKVAWYGDRDFDYRYSGHSRLALPWTDELLLIKELADQFCETSFNSCLLNLYHNGSEGMGWHSDDEKSLDPDAPIASISFGQERRFLFRLRSDHGQKKEILLENGSLLLMDASSQRFWQHSLPVSKKSTGARINLTFRRMRES